MCYQTLELSDLNRIAGGSEIFIVIETQQGINFNIEWNWIHLLARLIIDKSYSIITLGNETQFLINNNLAGNIEKIIPYEDGLIIRNNNQQQVIIGPEWNEWFEKAIRTPVNMNKLEEIKRKIQESEDSD